MRFLSGKTRVLGILGHPVSHSLSPLMQNAALEASGLDYVYVPFDVSPERLSEAIAGLRALGVAGFNVTIPHKTAIIPFLDDLDGSAQAAGAVNTVCNRNGRLVGSNTDGAGLLRSLRDDLQFEPQGATVVMVGAGGAAAGAAAALCHAGISRLVIANRSLERAARLVDTLRQQYASCELVAIDTLPALSPYMAGADLLLNTTSLGMQHETIPFVDLVDLPDGAKIYDMIYAPPMTPLLQEAAARGFSVANGLGMLAGQGELAFQLWTGMNPPVGLMRRVLANICND